MKLEQLAERLRTKISMLEEEECRLRSQLESLRQKAAFEERFKELRASLSARAA